MFLGCTVYPVCYLWCIVIILGDWVCGICFCILIILGDAVFTLRLFGAFLVYYWGFVQCGCRCCFFYHSKRWRRFLLHPWMSLPGFSTLAVGFFFFMLPEFSAVMLKIVSNLLNWLIPLLSIVIFNFPFSVFVICCDTCTTASLGATLVFVMYLWLNYTVSGTLLVPLSLLCTL